ncbi:hypothetical protein HDV00_007481 [Rhizophlyctis rosea]|nr:hypothetical protein HDV00_007481 [Rhizophlyctis rosea]
MLATEFPNTSAYQYRPDMAGYDARFSEWLNDEQQRNWLQPMVYWVSANKCFVKQQSGVKYGDVIAALRKEWKRLKIKHKLFIDRLPTDSVNAWAELGALGPVRNAEGQTPAQVMDWLRTTE